MADFWVYLAGALVSIAACGSASAFIYLMLLDRKYSHIPGPPNDSLLFGHLSTAMRKKKEGKFLGEMVLDWTKIYGKTVKMRFVDQVFVATAEPEAIRELLITGNHPKPDMAYAILHHLFWERFLGKGLLIETNQKQWVWKRSLINPCFQKSYLKGLETSFNTQADILMNRLDEVADGKTKVIMLNEFLHLTLDTICQLAFGIEVNAVENRAKATEITKIMNTLLKGLTEFVRNPLFKYNIIQWRFIRDVRKAARYLRTFSRKCFKDRMLAIQNGHYTPDDILNHLVKIKLENPELDEEVIIDDITTFFIAGSETSANVLSFTLINLWKNKEVQERLRREVNDVVGVKPFISSDDLRQMTYLDMVIKETLRLYPPAQQTFREAKHDIEIGGYKIPAGTNVLMLTYVSSRLEEFHPDPLKFDPERFNLESENKIPPYSYFPFTLGPRTCIGKNFAKTEVKIILTKILQRFNFEMDPDQSFEIEETTTLRPKGKAVCTFTLCQSAE